ncbi:hypothetical protein ACIOUG_10500 [Pseudomonas sp. NPDC087803]|uniref:hypothetical protein n=1 Tax=Pseudomonas sp. NPDC087803 TaxID=3364448 RepID=UPI0037F57BF3
MARLYKLLTVGHAVLALSKSGRSADYDDLVQSNLLAQLVANKKIEDAKVESWYDAYIAVLDDFWVRSVKFREDFSVAQAGTGSALGWATTVLANNAGNDPVLAGLVAYAARMPDGVSAVQTLPEPTGEEPMQTPRPALQRVRLLTVAAQSPTSISSLYLEFKTRQTLAANPWSQRFASAEVEGPVCVRYARATLSQTLYALSRQAVTRKLGDRLAQNVAPLAEAIDIGV